MQPQYTKIYETIVGSTAYGLNTPESDIDIKGVAIPGLEHIFGIHPFEQHEITADNTIFSLQKFVHLASNINPNIIEMLYTDETDIVFISKYGRYLRNNANLFLSKRAKYTFGGYAYAQLKRINGHQKWINNPQEQPKREDFVIIKDIILSNGAVKKVEKFLEKDYDAACNRYVQYLTWKKERNPERAKLEELFKYDCKHGMHLIRLLKMGIEILKEGKVIVKRIEDKEELMGIRNGKMSYEELVRYAESLMNDLETAYQKSDLPEQVNYKKIDRFLIMLQKEFYGIQ